jgi:hypothetical protein
MKKHSVRPVLARKLRLDTTTIRSLDAALLVDAHGGRIPQSNWISCNCTASQDDC